MIEHEFCQYNANNHELLTCNCAPRTHSLNTPQPLNARTMLNSATDVSAFGRRLHALLMRARRIKSFAGGGKCCSKGKDRQVTHPQQRSNAMRHRREPARYDSPHPRPPPGAQRTCNLAVRRQSMPATPASGLCPKRAIQHQK